MSKRYRIAKVTLMPSDNRGMSVDRFLYYIEEKCLFGWKKVRGYADYPIDFPTEKQAKEYADALRRVGQVTYIEVW